MKGILTSTSKLVFLMIAITASLGFATGLLPVEAFMTLAGMTFGYYFTREAKK